MQQIRVFIGYLIKDANVQQFDNFQQRLAVMLKILKIQSTVQEVAFQKSIARNYVLSIVDGAGYCSTI